MRSLLYILLFAGSFFSVSAQTEELPLGLLFEDEAYDALPRQSPEDGSKADLPSSIDLSSYCPEVRHQGYIFSCVGWATGYGAMTIQRAILNRCTTRNIVTHNAYSALFLYNQIKEGDCQRGSRITDALDFLTKNGDCLAKQFDFNVNDCEQAPDESLQQVAKRFAIEDYVALFGSNDEPDLKVRQVKRMLAQHRPVIVGLSVLRNFYDLKNAKFWWPEIGNTAPAGGHAMVVVGYDDRREAFRLFNSWGKNWGDNGFIWIRYKDFGNFCKYGFVLYLLSNQPVQSDTTVAPQLVALPQERPLLELAGNFEFRNFTGYSEHSGQAQFETASVEFRNNRYRTRQDIWQVGQLFQLAATTHRGEEYLYVFSIDAQRMVHFHWPRQEGLNEKFSGKNETGLLVSSGSEIIVPGETKALKLAHPGTDRLIVLFSKKKINGIRPLAEILSRTEGDFMKALLHALGNYAIPPSDIRYFEDHMGFEAQSRSEGYIVPLVLEVEAN